MPLIDFLLANLTVIVGALIQASTGVGGGFIVVPALAAIDLALIPGPVILASLPLSVAMALRGRTLIDSQNFPAIALGLIPGSLVGAYVLSQVPLENAGVLFGGVVLIGAGLSLAGLVVRVSRTSGFIAGAVSGVLGTSGGNGGVILALLYQHSPGPSLRATLGLLYFLASVIMLGVLAGFGRFGPTEVLQGVLMMPGFLLGFVLSPRLAQALDGPNARRAVLAMCVASALVLIVSSL